MKTNFALSFITATIFIHFSVAQNQHESSDRVNNNLKKEQLNRTERKSERQEKMETEDKEKTNLILTKKIDYLNRKLKLNQEEAQKFNPLYFEYSNKLYELKKSSREPIKKLKLDSAELANRELWKLADNELQLKQLELDLIKKYNEKFKSVISPIKVAKIYSLEELFYEEQILRSIRKEEKVSSPSIK